MNTLFVASLIVVLIDLLSTNYASCCKSIERTKRLIHTIFLCCLLLVSLFSHSTRYAVVHQLVRKLLQKYRAYKTFDPRYNSLLSLTCLTFFAWYQVLLPIQSFLHCVHCFLVVPLHPLLPCIKKL